MTDQVGNQPNLSFSNEKQQASKQKYTIALQILGNPVTDLVTSKKLT